LAIPQDQQYRPWAIPQDQKALSFSIALTSDPAWDDNGPGTGTREKIVSALVEKNINTAAPVLLKLFSAQAHNSTLPAEPTTWPTAKLFKNDHHWRAQNF
jgi:hypothetical protein